MEKKRPLSDELGEADIGPSKKPKTEEASATQSEPLDLLDERLSIHNDVLQSMEQSLLDTVSDGISNAGLTSTPPLPNPGLHYAQAEFAPAVRPSLQPREPTAKRASEQNFLADPEAFVDSLLLPLLANMANALLDFVIRCSPEQLTNLAEQPHSPHRRSWDRLLYAFESLREKFRSGSTYIDAVSVAYLPIRRNDDRSPQDSVGITNIASAVAELLVPTYPGLVELQSRLPDVFEPFAQFVQADRMDLIAGLLTQVHLARLKESLKRRELAHEDPFAQDLERHLTQSIAGDAAVNLRNEFWLKCRTIRQQLVNSTLADLVTSDCRLRFLRSLRRHLSENIRPGAQDFGDAEIVNSTSETESTVQGNSLLTNYSQSVEEGNDQGEEDVPFDQDMDAMIRAAAREARANMSGHTYSGNASRKPSALVHSISQAPQQAAPAPPPATAAPAAAAAAAAPLPTRAEPGAALAAASSPDASIIEKYKQARLADAASERQKQDRARNSTSGQRRAWSNEEEQALMQGLDKVQGPHWAKILAMFGEHGSVSTVLKDRNQVQCKDKARNLKLYFLKGGHELPPGLKLVTGELKTRAPGRASKMEMHEQLQRSASEDKATADAISALFSGPRAAPDDDPPPPPRPSHAVDDGDDDDDNDDGWTGTELGIDADALLARNTGASVAGTAPAVAAPAALVHGTGAV